MEPFNKFNQAIEELFGQNQKSDLQAVTEKSQPNGKPDVSERLDLSFIKLGDNYANLSNYEYAVECYREALKINPHNTMAFNRLILLPSHLIRHIPGRDSKIDLGDKEQLKSLALYDAFRQTFIGGYIVLSKQMDQMGKPSLSKLMHIIQNLEGNYFKKHSSPKRDFGILAQDGASYVWMLNSYESPEESPAKSFPVMILMKRGEYQHFRKLLRTNNS